MVHARHQAALRTVWPGPIHLVWVERLAEGKVFCEDLPAAANSDWIRDLVLDCLEPERAQFMPSRECLAKGPDRESIQDALEDPRRRRDLLEELLRPTLPDLDEEAFSALLSRRFRPWMEAKG